jgi:hypothetical protein
MGKKSLPIPEKGIYCLPFGSRTFYFFTSTNFKGGETDMGRIRRTSSVITKASVRSNNLKSISETLDLGGGLSVTAFDTLIAQAEAVQDDYNRGVAALDEKGNQLDDLLKQVGEMSSRLLGGVGARYGKNSSEYEKAGGVRTEEIKRAKKGSKGGNGGNSSKA